jgi:hypothetical protein
MKSLSQLSDHELVASFRDVIVEAQERLVFELDHFIELDRRKLFASHSSLWAYVVHEYGMEEWEADRKIRASRLMKRYPEVRRLLELGKIHLSLLELVQGYVHREKLGEREFGELLELVQGLSLRAAKRELASRYPESAELHKDSVRPFDEKHSIVRFIADEALLEKIEEIRGLLAHSHPRATLSEIVNYLATDFLKRNHPVEKAKRAEQRAKRVEEKSKRAEEKAAKKTAEPLAPSESPSSLIKTPAAPRVMPSVWEPKSMPPSCAPQAMPSDWEPNAMPPSCTPKAMPRTATQAMTYAMIRRDGYSCSYVDPQSGKKCTSRYGLQKDHIQSWQRDGKTELQNLRFLCQGHHQRVSFLEFGESSKYFRPKRE